MNELGCGLRHIATQLVSSVMNYKFQTETSSKNFEERKYGDWYS